jgi:hypothetical protein
MRHLALMALWVLGVGFLVPGMGSDVSSSGLSQHLDSSGGAPNPEPEPNPEPGTQNPHPEPGTQRQEPRSFSVAFYNIQSGHGQAPLPGRPCVFQEGRSCDSSRPAPLNAWGRGVVQAELRRALADERVIALGLGESWTTVCASPERVRAALGWKSHVGERNGVSLVTRHGIVGAATWRKLDTDRNPNPKDTKWVVHARACVDAACAATFDVFVAHWYSSGSVAADVYDTQARQTLAFMKEIAADRPHALVGDLNVWVGDRPVCAQQPNADALQHLRDAGYVDVWPALHGNTDGATGMWNRRGCGRPEGNLWKRIDYAWAKRLRPIAMTRFGMVTPGECAPSDHAGISVEYQQNR